VTVEEAGEGETAADAVGEDKDVYNRDILPQMKQIIV